ncbi:MAG: PAS domain-containing protein [Myxococcaceae bacterium]
MANTRGLCVKPNTIPLIDQPRAFELDELFFSTTDRKGIIETGNQVFVRLSGYELHQLIGEPHNIIRHPHMPRAAFALVWDALLAGRPIAALVKNLAKDGRYYWVLAYIAPIKDGFLSVRTKPCSQLFPVVKGLYAEMVAIEEAELAAGKPPKDAMAASTKFLVEKLGSLGFESYDDFCARALVPTETAARRAGLRERLEERKRHELPETLRTPMRRVANGLRALQECNASFMAVLERAFAAIGGGRKLLKEFSGLQLSAVNVSLRAARLGRQGRATMAIATFLSESTDRLQRDMGSLCTALDAARVALSGLVIELGWSALEVEMVQQAIDEWLEARDRGAKAEELNVHGLGGERLYDALAGTATRMSERVKAFKVSVTNAGRLADAVNALTMSLDAAYTNGGVESARLPASAKLGELLTDLGKRLQRAHQAVASTQSAAAELAGLEAINQKAHEALTAAESGLHEALGQLGRHLAAKAA